MRRKLCMLIVLGLFAQAQAAVMEAPLPDAAQERVARETFRALRCMVCEGQSLAESDATLAVQMRAHVRSMAAQGQTPDQIEMYFRDHYGERILMSPPFEPGTAMLWMAPFLLLAIGAVALWRMTRPKEDKTP